MYLHAEGRARLVDRHTVEVTLPDGGKKRLTAKNILLAQGGRPIKADVPGKVALRHSAGHTMHWHCLMAMQ